MSERIPIEISKDLEALIPGYLERLTASLEQLDGFLAAGQLQEVKRIGHNFKGSGGGYGFDKISELGAAIEKACVESDSAKARAHVAELKDYASRIDVKFV